MKNIGILVLFVFALIGCNENDGGATSGGNGINNTPTKVSPPGISLDSHRSIDTTVNITCGGAWSINDVPNWCTFTQVSGSGSCKVGLKVSRNEATERRYATIKVNDYVMHIDQQGDILDNGEIVGALQPHSSLVIKEYRKRGDGWFAISDTYTLVGETKEVRFYYERNTNSKSYYIEAWLPVRYKVSNSYLTDTFRIQIPYENSGAHVGSALLKSNLYELKNPRLFVSGGNAINPANGFSRVVSEDQLLIDFLNSKFTGTYSHVYYVVDGTLFLNLQ